MKLAVFAKELAKKYAIEEPIPEIDSEYLNADLDEIVGRWEDFFSQMGPISSSQKSLLRMLAKGTLSPEDMLKMQSEWINKQFINLKHASRVLDTIKTITAHRKK